MGGKGRTAPGGPWNGHCGVVQGKYRTAKDHGKAFKGWQGGKQKLDTELQPKQNERIPHSTPCEKQKPIKNSRGAKRGVACPSPTKRGGTIRVPMKKFRGGKKFGRGAWGNQAKGLAGQWATENKKCGTGGGWGVPDRNRAGKQKKA